MVCLWPLYKTFIILGLNTITIANISPAFGAVGATIKIAGIGFSSTVRENSVSFDGGSTYVVAEEFRGDMRSGAPLVIDTLVVDVPSGTQAGTIIIRVKILTGTPAEYRPGFEVVPEITNIVPEMAQVNATIKIAGTGFSSTFTEDSVLFSGSEYIVASNFLPDMRDGATRGNDPEIDTVVVSVPSDAMTGTISVKVLNGTAPTSLQSFVVLLASAPEITSIAPTSGPVNTEITISGQNFGATEGDNDILFLGGVGGGDNREATAYFTSPTEIRVRVPMRTVTGRIKVSTFVNRQRLSSTSQQIFTVEGSGPGPGPTLRITNIVPRMAQVNATIKIAGTGFSSTFTEDSVLFSGSEYFVASNFLPDMRDDATRGNDP